MINNNLFICCFFSSFGRIRTKPSKAIIAIMVAVKIKAPIFLSLRLILGFINYIVTFFSQKFITIALKINIIE